MTKYSERILRNVRHISHDIVCSIKWAFDTFENSKIYLSVKIKFCNNFMTPNLSRKKKAHLRHTRYVY